MLKKLQSLKAKKGFTLVELIVVIAIIAVLAAILVPTMLGYVTSSRVTSADSTAASLKDTVGNAMVETDTKGEKVPRSSTLVTIEITGTSASPSVGGGTFATDYPKFADAIKDKIKNDYNFTKAMAAVVYLKDGKVIGCAYSATAGIGDVKAVTDTMLTNGSGGPWDNTDGIKGDHIIGTSPKVTKTS